MHHMPSAEWPARTRCPRSRRAVLVTAGVLAAGIALAACGSGGSSPPDAASSPASGSTQGTGLLAYSSCMRSHGVPNFPDPTSSGGIPKETGRQLGVSLPQLEAAQKDCQHLIPAGESLSGRASRTIPVQDQQDYLKAAACMRSHGITNFPEPVFQGGQVEFPMLQHLVDLSSSQFKQAFKICQKDIPPGLPDSGSAG